ncbi:MAG: ArsA-related P-loop ATPase, partial [Chloroflexota bacterium]
GAAMRLLSAPDLQRWYTRHLVGLTRGLARAMWPSVRALVKLPVGEGVIQARIQELFDQVSELRALLTDPQQTSVRLVLNPDHMSLRETQRAYTYMSLFGFSVDAILVNRILPEAVQDPFFDGWKASQAAYRAEIQTTFAPLPVFEVPLLRREVVGLAALEALGGELFPPHIVPDPVAALSVEPPLRFYVEGERHILDLRVTGVAAGAVELEKRGDELSVRLGRLRRTLVLPQYLAGLKPAWAQVQAGHLKVAFEEPPR